jgi:hypothetical protein
VAEGGFVVGVYVGYDDNRSMKKGRIALAGASGALPAWMATVQGLANSGLLGEPPVVDVVDGEAWPLNHGTEMARMFVDPSSGLPSPEGEETEAMTLVRKSLVVQEPDLEVPELVRPARVAPSTEMAVVEDERRERKRQQAAEAVAEAEAEKLEASGGVTE